MVAAAALMAEIVAQGIYFGFDFESDPPASTSLARVDPDGSVTGAASGLLFPNGMALTPDGGTMIIAETYGARLTAFAVDPDGSLSNRRVWADLRGTGIYPDGSASPSLEPAGRESTEGTQQWDD